MADPMNKEDLGPLPQVFEPGKRYQVQLTETVLLANVTFSPAHINTFEGAFAESIRDKISSAREAI